MTLKSVNLWKVFIKVYDKTQNMQVYILYI